MNNLLYISLNGYAGSGKDTVAKMLNVILGYDWENIEECKEYYFSKHTNPLQSATFNFNEDDSKVLCIAYADQLKAICSIIFGIPMKRFYQNKSNAWVCINDKFQYTEIKPDNNNIITASDYYSSMSKYTDSTNKYWLSLREILVYVGTYVLQYTINEKIFVNIVRNKILEYQKSHENLQYVILTDNRFSHEIDFSKENNAVSMTITRNSISQLDNIAEHQLDDEEYEYVINNSGSYDELFDQLWDLTHNDIQFKNITISLENSEGINNYLRLIDQSTTHNIYRLCSSQKILHLYKSNDTIIEINPVGGPCISINQEIDGTNIIPEQITYEPDGEYFEILALRNDK